MVSTALLVLAATVGAILLAFEVKTAKSGEDLRSTYRMYHFGLLGTVRFGDCEVKASPPWLPQFDSYQDVRSKDNEVVFVDYTKLGMKQPAPDFSLIRRDDAFQDARLGPAKEVNGMKVRVVDEGLTKTKALFVAWIVDSRVYAVSSNPDTLASALSSIELKCGK